MGVVTDHIDCPDCGSEAQNDFHYNSGEEFIMCNQCGYTRKFYIKNLEDQHKQGEFEWVPDYDLEEIRGCGTYMIRQKNSLAYEWGAFTTPEAEAEIVSLIQGRKEELAHAEYTTFVDGVLTKTILIQEEERPEDMIIE